MTTAVMGRMKFSSCLAKHSWLCSLNSISKGQQIRLLRSHDLEYVEKTTKPTNESLLEQRVVIILFIRMAQVIHSKYPLLNRFYASGITESNISLTTFVDLKYMLGFFFWCTDAKQSTVSIASLFKGSSFTSPAPSTVYEKNTTKKFPGKIETILKSYNRNHSNKHF